MNRLFVLLTVAATALAGCTDVANSSALTCEQPAFEEGATNPIVGIETTMGCIYGEIFVDLVPTTGGNFVALAEDGLYDGSPFHRVISNFMMQGGDYTDGNGRGGRAHDDYANAQGNIDDEFHPELRHDKKGMFSMANAGANTGSSQFFITFGPTAWLDDKHAVFGQVVDGMDVVDRVNAEVGSKSGAPNIPLTFVSATVYWPSVDAEA